MRIGAARSSQSKVWTGGIEFLTSVPESGGCDFSVAAASAADAEGCAGFFVSASGVDATGCGAFPVAGADRFVDRSRSLVPRGCEMVGPAV